MTARRIEQDSRKVSKPERQLTVGGRAKVDLHHGNLEEGKIRGVVPIKRTENRLAVALRSLIKVLACGPLFVLAYYIAIPLLIPKKLRGEA